MCFRVNIRANIRANIRVNIILPRNLSPSAM